jgi:hypothetical protein
MLRRKHPSAIDIPQPCSLSAAVIGVGSGSGSGAGSGIGFGSSHYRFMALGFGEELARVQCQDIVDTFSARTSLTGADRAHALEGASSDGFESRIRGTRHARRGKCSRPMP